MSSLKQSPFHLLGVTTRDDRRRIVALAEEKSLELDAAVSQKARPNLANPRTRLTAEAAWLPGVSPNRAAQLVELVLRSPDTVHAGTGLPLLAHANLLAEAFGRVSGDGDPEEIAGYIDELATLVDELSADGVAREINEDRWVAGFPEVRVDHVEAELAKRKRYFRDVIKAALNRMPPTALIATLTSAVEDASGPGGYYSCLSRELAAKGHR